MRNHPIYAILTLAFLVTACSRDHSAAPASDEKKEKAESRVSHGTNGETILTLDAETQKIIGLAVAPVESTELVPNVKGFGRVLDAAPLAALVTDFAAAGAASQASEAELKRLKTLASQDNASQRALETAQAAASRDLATAQSIRMKLLSTWGQAIASRPDLPEFAHSLVALESALVEVDLPAGEAISTLPKSAILMTLAGDSKPNPAEVVGLAPAVDPQTQGQGFLLLAKPNAMRLVPGAAVTALLSRPGAPVPGVLVPREAIIRFNGATWIYQQSGDTTFERLPVSLERPMEKGWFVREGVKAGDKVVIAGAQQMLSEELKGQGGE
jgi:hypothetical protein